MPIEEFLEKHQIKFESKLVDSRCPVDCWEGQYNTNMQFLDVYPRLVHSHGKRYRVTFSAVSRKSVTFDNCWSSYKQEEDAYILRVVRQAGPVQALKSALLGSGDCLGIVELEKMWYGSLGQRILVWQALEKEQDEDGRISESMTHVAIKPLEFFRSLPMDLIDDYEAWCARRGLQPSSRRSLNKTSVQIFDEETKKQRKLSKFFSPNEMREMAGDV